MKVVINKCYGGFSLSPRAVARLAELQGRPCFFFKQLSGDIYQKVPTTIEELDQESRPFFSAYDVAEAEVNAHAQRDWHSLSDEQKKSSNEWHDVHGFETRSFDRHDPLLIRIVEELGEKASGGFAKLKIVEIPDGTNYEIDEYDGMESVHEVHQSWG